MPRKTAADMADDEWRQKGDRQERNGGEHRQRSSRQHRRASDDPAPATIRATPYQWIDPRSIPPRDWLFERHLIRKFASLTIAPGGVGKSSLELVEAVSMATGRNLLTGAAIKPLRVWCWNGEDPKEELQRRIQAVCLHYSVGPLEFGNRLFLDSGREQKIIIAREDRAEGLIVAEPLIESIKATIAHNEIDVLSVDPFVSCHRVPENDNGKIQVVAETWAAIAEAANCAVELVHHVRKGNGELTADDARGAVALVAAARSVRVLNVMTKDEAAKAGITDHRRYFRIDPTAKANLAPPAEAAIWRRFESVDLGNSTPARPADHVGVVTAWSWPDPFEEVTVDDLRHVQQQINKGKWREDVQSKAWAGKAVADALDLDLEDASAKSKVKGLLKTWIKTDSLRVVQSLDDGRKARRFVEVGTWA